jgi:small-conductance mechanosensitive channel
VAVLLLLALALGDGEGEEGGVRVGEGQGEGVPEPAACEGEAETEGLALALPPPPPSPAAPEVALGGALGVGIGLGLQQIAANFVSGIILLIEGQTTVGDFVELDGGEKGTIVKMTARACVLETFDGKWIVVPNDHFITTRVINYSDQGSANRYEVTFSVPYEIDITRVPDLVCSAVARLPFVLPAPEAPDVELRGFGESGIDFAVEYWVSGIDDGRNKYASQVRFAVFAALSEAGISMPYPRRVIEITPAP